LIVLAEHLGTEERPKDRAFTKVDEIFRMGGITHRTDVPVKR
jgi:hypothetical protein